MTSTLIKDVSDTAHWVAAYRAWESARSDALFHDPLAARLAGDLGHQIADKLNHPTALGNGWPIIARTKIIDDYVYEVVEGGCDCIVNLAAGLDTRPYRLKLPQAMRWIEVDLPGIIQFKTEELQNERPICQLERKAVDLANTQARARLLDEVVQAGKRVVVISEGLLVYLEPAQVVALSRDLMARTTIQYWIAEVASPGILARMNNSAKNELDRAPMKFGPANGIAFFEEQGWKVGRGRSLFKEGARFKRVPWYLRPFAYLPQANPRKPGNKPWTCVMRLERC